LNLDTADLQIGFAHPIETTPRLSSVIEISPSVWYFQIMTDSTPTIQQLSAHALQIGDRINTAGFEGQVLSNTPLALRVGTNGTAVMFRYGVVVFIGLTADEEAEFLERLQPRTFGRISPHEEEWAKIQIAKEAEEPIPVGGPILVREFSLERLLVISDALAKSVVLGRDEREVANVFDTIEPFARELARFGKTSRNRTDLLKLMGNALLVQHRVSGRVAVGEKPDVLWDRPDLERLYARLEDEYELSERVETLNRKLAVIADTATTLADIIDAKRTLRLELIVIFLIAFEIVVTAYEIYARNGH
jgi:required for meiotic nuclear division protein 1